MTSKMIHQICYGFHWSIMEWSQLGQNTDFFGSFCEFFVYVLLHPLNCTPSFCQIKDLIKICICGKFHHYSISGCESKNFQSFLYWFRNGSLLGAFFWPLFFKILFDQAQILTRSSPIKQTHCLKNPSKFWNLAQMKDSERLWSWSIFGPNLLPENQKYC